MSDANAVAQKEMDEEVNKFGFNRPAAKKESDSEDDEDQDMGDLDDDSADDADEEESEDKDTDTEDSDEEDDSEDSEDDSDSNDEDEDEDDEDDEEDSSQKKGKISFKKYNEMRSDLREARKELADEIAKSKALEAKLPDDFQERVKTLAKEIGIEDPENMGKMMALIKDASLGHVKGLENKISELEQQIADKKSAEVVDSFPQEWDSFEKTFLKQYPHATTEQLKEVRSKMRDLAGTEDIGGKVYIHPDTKQKALDPYPLDYIFFKNKEVFESLVTVRKTKGMETARTAAISSSEDKEDLNEAVLPKNASAEQIRKLDKAYSKAEAGSFDGLRAPTNSNI